ncbi:MAG: carboxymuconolactone decarboxylase family protein [Acidimicrobiales bacterium]
MVNSDDTTVPSGASLLARLEEREDRKPLDGNPQLRTFFACWLDTFILKGRVDPALRERAVLRVMWRCSQPFEWANHYRLARNIGLSDDDILAVRTSAPARDLPAGPALVVRAADEVVDLGRLTAATYAECEGLFADSSVLLEFLYLVAGYRMFATVSASSGRGYDGPLWPPDGIGPSHPDRRERDG